MRILALLHDRTIPARTGTRVRNFHLWPALARLGHDVRVLGLDLERKPETAKGPPGIVSSFYAPTRSSFPIRVISAFVYSHYLWPRSRELRHEVDRVITEWQPDVVHAEELTMAAYLPVMRGVRLGTRGKIALQTLTLHNVESDLRTRLGSASVPMAKSLSNNLHNLTLKGFERRAVHSVDLPFAYSAADMERYKMLYPEAHWRQTLNGANASGIEPYSGPIEPGILLVGSLSYAPNIEGLNWFFDKVRPLLNPALPITVAGSNATAGVRNRLKAEAVNFVDSPAELAPLYNEHSVCAVPLLEGSGTRGRILEALAFERPVVTTTKGAEGLNIGPGKGVIIADNPAEFAHALNQWAVRSDDQLRLARAGRQFVIDNFDWTVVANQLVADWNACISQ